MKYTIINTETQRVFIQQQYDKIEDANKRLGELKAKFATSALNPEIRLCGRDGEKHGLAVVRVDDSGAIHPLTDKPETKNEKPTK